MYLCEIVETSRQVSETRSRLSKVERLTACLQRLDSSEIALGVSYLTGQIPQGRLGVGPAALRSCPGGTAGTATLKLVDVDNACDRIRRAAGPGSAAEKHKHLAELMCKATPDERAFVVRLMLGDLRQGALEGVMLEAVARVTEIPIVALRRAVMLAGDLASVAKVLFVSGPAGLSEFSLRVLCPVQPMLAQPAGGVEQAIAQLGIASFEYKVDGVRVQVHKANDDVRVFTRRQHDVTAAAPEIVESVRSLPARELILDGETIALGSDGRPYPFQVTMRRFGRRLGIERMRESLPLTAFFFDCLRYDDEDLIDQPMRKRIDALTDALPAQLIIPREITGDARQAQLFLDRALQQGHEGVMAKSLDAGYDAGSRGRSWLKIKPALTLDLVVLAAEWGHGRRKGWLSNLHLGARDPQEGNFVMLGKTFKGLTDEMLSWQTQRFQELAIGTDDYTVYVRPELVVEIAFNEIQQSPLYPGGLALRFARVKRYRSDKQANQADTIDTVRALHTQQIARQ